MRVCCNERERVHHDVEDGEGGFHKKNKSAMTCEMVEEAANARKSPCIAVVSLKLVHVLFRLLTHAMLQMHLYCNLFCDMHRKQR